MRHDCLFRASFSVAMKSEFKSQNQNIRRLEDDKKLKKKNPWAVSE